MNRLLLILIAPISIGLSALAQPVDQPRGWSTEVGAGLISSPMYRGADEQQLMLVPDVRVSYDDVFSASVARGARYVAWREGNAQAGPLARIDFGRDEDGDSPFRIAGDDPVALRGLHEVDATVLAGLFVAYETGAWKAEAELLQGLGGHEGLVAVLSLDHTVTLSAPDDRGPPWIIATGPWFQWASADYNDAYFGLTAADALASGLTRYEAEAGVNAAGWAARVVRPLTRSAALFAFVNYERLLGDAADSPLVRERGDANQFSAGLFVSYKL